MQKLVHVLIFCKQFRADRLTENSLEILDLRKKKRDQNSRDNFGAFFIRGFRTKTEIFHVNFVLQM